MSLRTRAAALFATSIAFTATLISACGGSETREVIDETPEGVRPLIVDTRVKDELDVGVGNPVDWYVIRGAEPGLLYIELQLDAADAIHDVELAVIDARGRLLQRQRPRWSGLFGLRLDLDERTLSAPLFIKVSAGRGSSTYALAAYVMQPVHRPHDDLRPGDHPPPVTSPPRRRRRRGTRSPPPHRARPARTQPTDELFDGQILYNIRRTMQIGQPVRTEVRLGFGALAVALDRPGEVIRADVLAAAHMTVELDGSPAGALHIRPITPTRQRIVGAPARWLFEVTPSRPGVHTLTLVANAHLSIDGVESTSTVHLDEHRVRVIGTPEDAPSPSPPARPSRRARAAPRATATTDDVVASRRSPTRPGAAPSPPAAPPSDAAPPAEMTTPLPPGVAARVGAIDIPRARLDQAMTMHLGRSPDTADLTRVDAAWHLALRAAIEDALIEQAGADFGLGISDEALDTASTRRAARFGGDEALRRRYLRKSGLTPADARAALRRDAIVDTLRTYCWPRVTETAAARRDYARLRGEPVPHRSAAGRAGCVSRAALLDVLALAIPIVVADRSSP